MKDLISPELERLRARFAALDFALPLREPATPRELLAAERETGIRLDPHLQQFYAITNGSCGAAWLAVRTDELTPCTFPALSECLSWWREWLPYDEAVHAEWGPTEPGRDRRIQPNYYVHRHWFPIAEFNCWGTTVFFDADPTHYGAYGQIIAYQHDPDAVHYLAADFLTFFRVAVDLMLTHATELLLVDGHPAFVAPPRLV